MDDSREWLEADGLGGFASGTVSGIRTRRYHAWLLAATTPPTGRMVLVQGADAVVVTPHGRFPISSQRYRGDVVHPGGHAHLVSFTNEPWPTWRFLLPDGCEVVQELLVPKGEAPEDRARCVVSWRLVAPRDGVSLELRPLLSGRDYHALHHENGAFRMEPIEQREQALRFFPYAGVPQIAVQHNGRYEHAPAWYRSFVYSAERARGFDHTEDLASPGVFWFDLSAADAVWIASAARSDDARALDGDPRALRERLARHERERRASFGTPLERAADAYLVARGAGLSIVAGYPWFTDWGRDTFLSLRGLCLSTGRLDEARLVLGEWAQHVDGGLLPNRFPDGAEAVEYHSVDAPLWFVVAAHELEAKARAAGRPLPVREKRALHDAIQAILTGMKQGTRHGIALDSDGLLRAGEPGRQLTWMDAKIGDRVVTPRIGKPVEVQALWLNALEIGGLRDPQWLGVLGRGSETFARRFWNAGEDCLYDVVDADHRPGTVDAAFRPNQILAVGGLPSAVLHGSRARRMVRAVEQRLWTPLGLRSLAPGTPGYTGRYTGGPVERDEAYHQGTVWPWLVGAFVEAWLRTGLGTRAQARARFVQPLLDHLGEAGIGHVSEVADGDAPHAPGGCPFQAWSVGELLRLCHGVLAERQSERVHEARHAGSKRGDATASALAG